MVNMHIIFLFKGPEHYYVLKLKKCIIFIKHRFTQNHTLVRVNYF